MNPAILMQKLMHMPPPPYHSPGEAKYCNLAVKAVRTCTNHIKLIYNQFSTHTHGISNVHQSHPRVDFLRFGRMSVASIHTNNSIISSSTNFMHQYIMMHALRSGSITYHVCISPLAILK